MHGNTLQMVKHYVNTIVNSTLEKKEVINLISYTEKVIT